MRQNSCRMLQLELEKSCSMLQLDRPWLVACCNQACCYTCRLEGIDGTQDMNRGDSTPWCTTEVYKGCEQSEGIQHQLLRLLPWHAHIMCYNTGATTLLKTNCTGMPEQAHISNRHTGFEASRDRGTPGWRPDKDCMHTPVLKPRQQCSPLGSHEQQAKFQSPKCRSPAATAGHDALPAQIQASSSILSL
jgi:hypothetical protein